MERAAALLVFLGPGEVHEDTAHHSGGHSKEVRAILPLDPADINQAEIGLVHECRGLEHVTGALTCHVALGNPPELVVHERQQFLHRLFASTPPLEEERRQVMGSYIRHASGLARGFAGFRSVLPAHSTP